MEDPKLNQKIYKVKRFLNSNKFVYSGSESIRSESDNGLYLKAVKRSTSNYKKFSNFKQNSSYSEILEHVTYKQGLAYLTVINSRENAVKSKLSELTVNDQIGNPKTFEYTIGKFSPTTLRYSKVSSDLVEIFGEKIGKNWVEIGAGYGGQALINDRIFSIENYNIVDLQPVLSLISMYLDHHILKMSYSTFTMNQFPQMEVEYDLAISNYAFSEFPIELQKVSIQKVFSKSKRGYLTMNTGKPEDPRSKNRLTVSELRNFLPKFEIIEETPLTHPGNYIIVWGR